MSKKLLWDICEDVQETISVEVAPVLSEALENYSFKSWIVQNVKGSSERSPKCPNCGPWIQHWKILTGKEPKRCAVHHCKETANLVGGHVKSAAEKEGGWFIVPLCRDHNNKPGRYNIIKDTPQAPANVAESCGKNK